LEKEAKGLTSIPMKARLWGSGRCEAFKGTQEKNARHMLFAGRLYWYYYQLQQNQILHASP